MKKIFGLLLITAGVFASFLLMAPGKSAAAFNANNLMDDGVFERSNLMSPAQIDNWINQFPSSCISSNSGFRTPDPQGWSAAQNQYLFGGNVTVGQAIYDTAQLYHVNPQVILSTMQKEQSLVTGSAGCYNEPNPATATPMTNQCGSGTRNCTLACTHAGGCMNIAMGYGCPGYCDAKDEGFSMQLTLGTWLLRFGEQRAYGNLTGYVGYEQGDENFTYTGPMTQGTRKRSASSAAISYDGLYTTQDGVTVSIANGATASLYNFTPFTSGNSNFDTIFQNWFGSLYDIYTWSVTSQYAYTDQTKSTPMDLTNLLPGQKAWIGFVAKNTGTASWVNSGANAVRTGTTLPQDRNSPFCDLADSPVWLGCNRPANMTEASVAPGGNGTFEFWYVAPSQPRTYDEHFSLVAEGLKWMNDTGMYFHTVVKPPTYTWLVASQYAYVDQSKATSADLANLVPGQKVWIGFKAKNTGNVSWTNSGSNPIRVGTSNPMDRSSPFCDSSWLGCNRPVSMSEAAVAPGQTATFEFWYKAPASTGVYTEYFRPVVEGIQWMNDLGLNFYTVVHFDTSGTSSVLGTNQTLNVGQSITSSDGRYRVVMQGDGNLVLYSINRALWSSNTAGKPVVRVVMQGDGNLVLYDVQNKPYWSSGTAGKGSSNLIMQGDGNLVIYDGGGRPTWFSSTNGQL
jgi:hypothetical protein